MDFKQPTTNYYDQLLSSINSKIRFLKMVYTKTGGSPQKLAIIRESIVNSLKHKSASTPSTGLVSYWSSLYESINKFQKKHLELFTWKIKVLRKCEKCRAFNQYLFKSWNFRLFNSGQKWPLIELQTLNFKSPRRLKEKGKTTSYSQQKRKNLIILSF